MELYLRYSSQSARGFTRSNNEDAAFAGPRLLALADGMGGHAAGEIAAALVIAEFAPLNDRPPAEDIRAELHDATDRASETIARYVAERPDVSGMGTTLTAILFAGSRLGLVHVGDSRAYLLRDGSLTQMTKDDTLVQSMIDEGRLTPDEARTHPQRSMVIRAMTGKPLEPFLDEREVHLGDRYMICSDGLSDVVASAAIAEALQRGSPEKCAEALVQTALRSDSPDNVTCIVADVLDHDCGYDIPLISGAAGSAGALSRP